MTASYSLNVVGRLGDKLSATVQEQQQLRLRNLFEEPVIADPRTRLNTNVHILKMRNGAFRLEELYTELKNLAIFYVLTRQEIQELEADMSRMGEFTQIARDKFKSPDSTAGEGGELILYSFLETYLGAPKILSKMPLKTSDEHYIHGSDGIHFLEINGEVQVVMGESKMLASSTEKDSSLRKGIKDAIESIAGVAKSGFKTEDYLISRNLMKEVPQSPLDLEAVENVLFGKSGEPAPDYSFGVFVGFEVDVTDLDPNEDFKIRETEILHRVHGLISKYQSYLEQQIDKHGLNKYSIYLYLVPFLRDTTQERACGIDDVREQIVKSIKGSV